MAYPENVCFNLGFTDIDEISAVWAITSKDLGSRMWSFDIWSSEIFNFPSMLE